MDTINKIVLAFVLGAMGCGYAGERELDLRYEFEDFQHTSLGNALVGKGYKVRPCVGYDLGAGTVEQGKPIVRIQLLVPRGAEASEREENIRQYQEACRANGAADYPGNVGRLVACFYGDNAKKIVHTLMPAECNGIYNFLENGSGRFCDRWDMVEQEVRWIDNQSSGTHWAAQPQQEHLTELRTKIAGIKANRDSVPRISPATPEEIQHSHTRKSWSKRCVHGIIAGATGLVVFNKFRQK